MAGADFPQAQRVAERKRMGDARLVVFGRDDGHVVRQFARDQFEELEPGRVDAVVVGEQDSHGDAFSHGRRVEASAFCRKRIRATAGWRLSERTPAYCGSGPSSGQPSLLHRIGENWSLEAPAASPS